MRERMPTSPCYLMRREADEGLQWVASAKREWRLADGKPAIKPLAAAVGVSFQNVYKIGEAPALPPANPTMARLVKIASAAHRVPRETAQARIFWFFDPDDPDDVERLAAYLADVDERPARAA